MAESVTLRALGLVIEPNQLDQNSTPPGSLAVASNVIIRRDSVIEPRRGYKLYGESFGTLSDRAKQLMTYKGRILRHYSNQLQYDTLINNQDDESIFDTFCGTYLEPQTGRRIRFLESNGNFYFTTDRGIQKISAVTAADFTTACPFITQAGGIKALDFSARLDPNPTGFLPPDSAVAYRIVWGYNDANKNEILGSPSERVVIFNGFEGPLMSSFNNLLVQLDNVSDNVAFPSLINDGNYFATLFLPPGSSAQDLYTNELALATKLDDDILYADQVSGAPLQIATASIDSGIATVSFSSGNPADYFVPDSHIKLAGFSPETGTLNGPQTISSLFSSFTTTGNTATGLQEITQVTTVADVTNSLAGTYFTINSAHDATAYYVWYNVSGNGTDPSIPSKTGIRININTNDTANTVAANTAAGIVGVTSDFTASALANVVTITNSSEGDSSDATSGTSGFGVVTTQQGTDGNIITSIADTSGINVGALITDTGSHIPANTYVTSVGSTSITISQDVTGSSTGDTLNFSPGINFNTTATGNVTLTNATINSNEYEFITPPAEPSNPATAQQLQDLGNYLQEIITQLQSEPDTGTPPTISSQSQTAFIAPLEVGGNANVILTITIPQEVTTNDFFQVYRSDIAQASGTQVLNTDIVPNDELKLVFEGFPTDADIAAGFVTVTDITPQEFAGAFLYTNPTTGEGILQANDDPPFALDINKFKNVAFYANTRKKFSQLINLLGVQQMLEDIGLGNTPSITITNGITTTTFTGVPGVQEITDVTTVADVAGSLAGKYFTLNSAVDFDKYYVWYKVSGVGTDPLVAGRTGLEVDINTGETAPDVATKTSDVIATITQDFTTSVSTNVITITNVDFGQTTDATAGTSGFGVVVTQQGQGQDAAQQQFLVSTNPSPAQAVDETARSIVHVINTAPNGIIYAFYLSGLDQPPGQMQFESRILDNNPFYILANDKLTGSSFNPDISPLFTISSIAVGNPTVITTSTPHGLINEEKVVISSSNSTPSVDGLWTITYISPTTFSIPVTVTVPGTKGGMSPAAQTLTADNLVKVHRIYYSKLLQPEAVPIVNFIDVGAQDKAILRIFPLRDSLFVFKEDGLFRISGETAPFNLALYDSSAILLAPDSLDVSNNLIYGWTTQGIVSTSESGVSIISRPIDIDILKLATSQYTNFRSATWGIGYESDNSYTAYTVQQTDDIYATIAYRYSTLTNTWTTFDKTSTCGVINSVDDRQYLGAGDTDFLEQERKNFNRLDYSDRQFIQQLELNNYFNTVLKLADVSNIEVGDVITQDQEMSVFNFNTLLEKLDNDVTLSPHDYETTQEMFAGDDPRDKLDALIAKIAADPGRNAQPGATPGSDYLVYQTITTVSTITSISASDPTVITTSAPHDLQTGRIITISGSNSVPLVDGKYEVSVLSPTTFTIQVAVTQPGTTGTLAVNNSDFEDIKASYNGVIVLLNNDLGVAFTNYNEIINQTSQEAIVINVDIFTKKVTLNQTLDFIVGPLTIFKAIDTIIQWAPQTFNDPVNLKHVYESTLMFENKAFSSAKLSFASDLIPSFTEIPFNGSGNGIFGYIGIPGSTQGKTGPTGFGYGFFGGGSHAAPFRTYIPRPVQYCRFLNARFEHNVARESYSIFGLTLKGNVLPESSRAYR